MTQIFDLSLSIPSADVTADARSYKIEASKTEMDALVERFKISSLESLIADLSVFSTSDYDAIIVSGNIKAQLKQYCIVSLDPVEETINEDFKLMLVSPEVADQFDDDEMYLDPKAPDYDAFEGGALELGEIVAQTMSVMMNLYPRRDDAELTAVKNPAVSINADLEKKPNPFAALSKLNDES